MNSQLLLTIVGTILVVGPIGLHHCEQDVPQDTITTSYNVSEQQEVNNVNTGNTTYTRCSRQSVILARQTLMHELDIINGYGPTWLNDLAKDELMDDQKKSLSGIMMSGLGGQLLTSDGLPLIEIEASYFKPAQAAVAAYDAMQLPLQQHQTYRTPLTQNSPSSINIKLQRRHPDRCHLSKDSAQYTYSFGLIVGPLEHNLDVVYNLPKELLLSQPMDRTYAQVKVVVPRMQYEITIKQVSESNLNSAWHGNCPLEISDVTYLGNPTVPPTAPNKPYTLVQASGLVATNQTILHLERLFNDYTRPTVSTRLRQALKFYLASKTLPLSV